MSYAFTMYERARAGNVFDDFDTMECVLEDHWEKLPYPPEINYLAFGTVQEEGDFLLGDQTEPQIRETMIVSLLTPEELNGEYCRECAKDVCMKLIELDTDKRILSVSAGKCEYERALGGYCITMKFGLREAKRNGGD